MIKKDVKTYQPAIRTGIFLSGSKPSEITLATSRSGPQSRELSAVLTR